MSKLHDMSSLSPVTMAMDAVTDEVVTPTGRDDPRLELVRKGQRQADEQRRREAQALEDHEAHREQIEADAREFEADVEAIEQRGADAERDSADVVTGEVEGESAYEKAMREMHERQDAFAQTRAQREQEAGYLPKVLRKYE